MKRIQKLQNDIKKWSDETFGMYRTGLPIAHHLKKETDEVIDAISTLHQGIYTNGTREDGIKKLSDAHKRVLFELTDCLTLVMDIAAHEGITMEQLIDASFTKLEINKKRKWGEPDENGVVEHIHE